MGVLSCQHDKVDAGEVGPPHAIVFPNKALHAIAPHRPRHVFPGNHNAEPARRRVRQRKHEKMTAGYLVPGLGKKRPGNPPLAASAPSGESRTQTSPEVTVPAAAGCSGRKTPSTPGAPPGKHLASAAGSHAGPEAMISGTLDPAGLKGSFHDTVRFETAGSGAPEAGARILELLRERFNLSCECIRGPQIDNKLSTVNSGRRSRCGKIFLRRVLSVARKIAIPKP